MNPSNQLTSASPTYIHKATVLSIHDGDTITLAIKIKRSQMKPLDLGFHIYAENGWITLHTPIRFNGINAPELSTQAGKDALAFLETQIKVGDTVTVQTYVNPIDKYGRWLGDIVTSAGVNLNDLMVSTGHAVVYNP